MTLYTLTMVMVECESFNNYERGVFTSLDKAKEGLAKALKHISLPKDTDFVMVEFTKSII